MRTQKSIQVEAIVNKYKNLALNTDIVKKTNELIAKTAEYPFCVDCGCDFNRLLFVDQLVGHIYQLKAGDSADINVINAYASTTSFYIKGLLQKDEEQFLVDNFDIFFDYAAENLSCNYTFDGESLEYNFYEPKEWSVLVPYLLENKKGNIFIVHSNKGKEFVGLENYEITVGLGFENAAIRALACGLSINKYKHDTEKSLWANIEKNKFNAVILESSSDDLFSLFNEVSFNSLWRIVNDGGEILWCVSKETILSTQAQTLCNKLIQKKVLQDVIQLPSGKVLLHIVKKQHDSIVMCDATTLSQKNNDKIIDIDTFLKEIEMANRPEKEELPIMRRYSYDILEESMLLPAYYLSLKNGLSLNNFITIESNVFLSDECSTEEKIVTINHLSNIFSKGEFKIDELPNLHNNRLRRYYRVNGPAVIMAVSEQDIVIGYTTEDKSFLVPHKFYVLIPKEGINVKYLAGKILAESKQLTRLVYGGSNLFAKLTKNWSKLVYVEIQSSEEEQQKFIQETILTDYMLQEKYIIAQDKSFKKSIRLRKHALSQNISAFDSLFRSLEFYIKEHKGFLNIEDKLSPISSITIKDAMTILRTNFNSMCDQVNHLTDEQEWGVCESIEPQKFIEYYEQSHANPKFKFKHLWDNFETNCFSKDILDKKTGKVLFYKGESLNTAWFPKKALLQVFDNIVSNACEHGFKDKNRIDYIIQTEWETNGFNMIIKISNNGEPISSDLNTDLIFEYGYSSVLNHNGHNGIGGGEIAEIMHKFGGDVNVISTPNKRFTVTYILTIPLASIY